jgi:spore maturation protein CgeB
MNVLLLGENWLGKTLENYYRAFCVLNCDVDVISFKQYKEYYKFYFINKFRYTNKLFEILQNKYNKLSTIIIEKYFEKKLLNLNFSKYDLVFVIKGNFLTQELIKEIKHKINCPLCLFIMDNPFVGFDTEPIIWFPRIAETINYYDYILVFDSYYIQYLKKITSSNIHFLPCSFNELDFFPINSRKKKIYDLTFLGSLTKFRKKIINKLLSDFEINIFTNETPKKHVLLPSEINYYYSISNINLNFSAYNSINGPNIRTFEITGSKGFIITDYVSDLEKLFDIDKEIICYSSIEELRDKIKFYLKNENLRNKISLAGYTRSINNHTYIHRVKELFNILDFKHYYEKKNFNNRI